MSSGRNRLERLFSKRKNESSPTRVHTQNHIGHTIAVSNNNNGPMLEESVFPAPSFLRPKGTRMMARDESNGTDQGEQRTRSLSEAPCERLSTHTSKPSTASTGEICAPSTRSATVSRRGKSPPTATDLPDFKFPRPPRSRGEASRVSPNTYSMLPISSPASATHVPTESLDYKHDTVHIHPSFDTPPASDHEDEPAPPLRLNKQASQHPSLAPIGPPTPESSPDMKPTRSLRSRDSDLCLARKRTSLAPLRRRKENKAAGLRGAHSYDRFKSDRSQSSTKVLMGGDFDTFLNMTDDDVAEDFPELPDSTTDDDSQTRSFKSTPMTRSASDPSPASKRAPIAEKVTSPAQTAAYGAVQIAKIAAKHRFDLAYIVNIWPEESKLSAPSPNSMAVPSSRGSSTRTPLGPTDGTMVESSAGMTGRLLAAYGLDKVARPFQISAAVHSKILGYEGWIEYRESSAKAGEFSRGYGHAFHTGGLNRPPTLSFNANDGCALVGGDRGIVFAAFRQPGKDGQTRGCTPSELRALHTDAERLVDELIALHKAKRVRNSMDDVGPMPSKKGFASRR